MIFILYQRSPKKDSLFAQFFRDQKKRLGGRTLFSVLPNGAGGIRTRVQTNVLNRRSYKVRFLLKTNLSEVEIKLILNQVS